MRILGSPLIVAWLAVVVSLAQLFLTVPMLTKFYMSAELRVSKMEWTIAGPSTGSFNLYNNGNGASRNIDVGLLLHLNSYVQLLPDVGHELKCAEKRVLLKSCRLLIDHIYPGEAVRVVIFRGERANDEVERRLAGLTSLGMAVPRLEYVYADDNVVKPFYPVETRNEVLGKVIR